MSANPYYPVTTSSDSAQLTDDDWGLSFTSSRKANVSRFKNFCQKNQSRSRCFIGIFVAVVVLLFVSIIVIVASRKSGGVPQKLPTGNEPAREIKTMGVNFFPITEDKSILIKYEPHIFKSNEAIRMSMDQVMTAYEASNQIGFVDCNSTYAPDDKSCKFTRSHFGSHCTSHNDYGYSLGYGCVLMQLELPEGMTIRKLSPDSELLTEDTDMPEIGDPAYVPITCKGSTKDDEALLEIMNMYTGEPSDISLFPEDGFANFMYRPRNTSLPFVKPAVMMWIRRLPHRHVMHITCTAWGQVYDALDAPVKHPLLQTTFGFFMVFGKPE